MNYSEVKESLVTLDKFLSANFPLTFNNDTTAYFNKIEEDVMFS